MLSDIRVLEISDPSTMLTGQMLGDLGADVVTIEKPEGAQGRRIEPFIHNRPGLERSLTWHAFNRNKRGMTLRCDCADGAALLRQLADRFDIVIEAIAPEQPSAFEDSALPQTTVHCTITPFSMSGPKAHYRPADLVLMAASGAPAMAGELGRQPLFFPVPQAMLEAGAEAAVAALAALAARDIDGLGQQSRVSARSAAIMGALGRAIAGFASDTPPARGADASGARLPNIYRCKDGFMVISIAFGPAFAPMTKQLVRWVIDQGALSEDYASINWLEQRQTASPEAGQHKAIRALVEAVTRLCESRTKLELSKAARMYKFMGAPVSDMADIANSVQFRERGSFASVRVSPDIPAIDIPARFIQFSDYAIDVRRPAPSLSEHTIEILNAELGLSLDEIQALFVHGVI